MNVPLSYRLSVVDVTGKVVKRTRWRKSQSYVIQWLRHIRCIMTALAEASTVDTGGVVRSIQTPSAGATTFSDLSVGAGVITEGIVVGSGATPVAIDDDSLDVQITHGAGAGQLNYGGTTIFAVDTGVGYSQVRVTETFANTSGGDVTVREIGVMVRTTDNAVVDRFFLIVRDIPVAQVVANGQTLVVEYAFRITL